MRLAFYSPLNPVSTGISDYSEELLPLLAREFDITLIVDGYKPSNPALAAFPVLNADELVSRSSSFDLILYHMGNSPAHAGIYRTLLEVPGVVVMHDVVLHHLRAWQTVDRRDVAGYKQAMRAEYGDAGAELAELEATWLAGLDRFDFPLSGAVARAARALVVHSEYAARQLQTLAPQAPIAVIPMGVPLEPPASSAAARNALGLPDSGSIVAAFGEIHPNKRVTVALSAFARFHARHPDSLFMLIGRESPNYDVTDVIDRLGIRGAVRLVGFSPRADYERYVAGADVCLNLRYPTAGETSASLLRLFAAGKAVIVTRTGAYADMPAGTCAAIEADEYEEEMLAAHIELLAARPDLRAQLGANAREFAEKCHTLELSAASYTNWLRAVAAG
ncbi:MAG: glycosyltransferase family 4 protein, partial [Rudaea sp.]